MKKFFSNLYAWYGSLPRPVQIALATAESVALGAAEQWFESGGNFSKVSLLHLGSVILVAESAALHNMFKPAPNAGNAKLSQ